MPPRLPTPRCLRFTHFCRVCGCSSRVHLCRLRTLRLVLAVLPHTTALRLLPLHYRLPSGSVLHTALPHTVTHHFAFTHLVWFCCPTLQLRFLCYFGYWLPPLLHTAWLVLRLPVTRCRFTVYGYVRSVVAVLPGWLRLQVTGLVWFVATTFAGYFIAFGSVPRLRLPATHGYAVAVHAVTFTPRSWVTFTDSPHGYVLGSVATVGLLVVGCCYVPTRSVRLVRATFTVWLVVTHFAFTYRCRLDFTAFAVRSAVWLRLHVATTHAHTTVTVRLLTHTFMPVGWVTGLRLVTHTYVAAGCGYHALRSRFLPVLRIWFLPGSHTRLRCCTRVGLRSHMLRGSVTRLRLDLRCRLRFTVTRLVLRFAVRLVVTVTFTVAFGLHCVHLPFYSLRLRFAFWFGLRTRTHTARLVTVVGLHTLPRSPPRLHYGCYALRLRYVTRYRYARLVYLRFTAACTRGCCILPVTCGWFAAAARSRITVTVVTVPGSVPTRGYVTTVLDYGYTFGYGSAGPHTPVTHTHTRFTFPTVQFSCYAVTLRLRFYAAARSQLVTGYTRTLWVRHVLRLHVYTVTRLYTRSVGLRFGYALPPRGYTRWILPHGYGYGSTRLPFGYRATVLWFYVTGYHAVGSPLRLRLRFTTVLRYTYVLPVPVTVLVYAFLPHTCRLRVCPRLRSAVTYHAVYRYGSGYVYVCRLVTPAGYVWLVTLRLRLRLRTLVTHYWMRLLHTYRSFSLVLLVPDSTTLLPPASYDHYGFCLPQFTVQVTTTGYLVIILPITDSPIHLILPTITRSYPTLQFYYLPHTYLHDAGFVWQVCV